MYAEEGDEDENRQNGAEDGSYGIDGEEQSCAAAESLDAATINGAQKREGKAHQDSGKKDGNHRDCLRDLYRRRDADKNGNAGYKHNGNQNRHQQLYYAERLRLATDSPRQQAIKQTAKSRTEEVNAEDDGEDVSRVDHKGNISHPENLADNGRETIEKRNGKQQRGGNPRLIMAGHLCLMNRGGRKSNIITEGNRQSNDGNHKVNNDSEEVSRSQAKRPYEPEPPCQTAERGAEGIDAIKQANARADDFVGIGNRPNQERQCRAHKETGHYEDGERQTESGDGANQH